jgi:hypothetical protein
LTRNKGKLRKYLIIALVFKKDAIFFSENCQKSQKILISTSIPPFQVIEPSQVLFSLETLIITVSAGAVAALVVGFVTGYCCGRRCQKDSEAGTLAHLGYPDAEYEYFEQRVGLARPTMLAGPGAGLMGGHIGGGPLIPTETSKLDNRQEEVTILTCLSFD